MVGSQAHILHTLEQLGREVEVEEVLGIVIHVLGVVIVEVPPGADFAHGQRSVPDDSHRQFGAVDILLDQGLSILFDQLGGGAS